MNLVFGGGAVGFDGYGFVDVGCSIAGVVLDGCSFVDVICGCEWARSCGWVCPCITFWIIPQIDFANFSFPDSTRCR